MSSLGSYSTSGREKEGIKERAGVFCEGCANFSSLIDLTDV